MFKLYTKPRVINNFYHFIYILSPIKLLRSVNLYNEKIKNSLTNDT